jgi:hypothetical protein
LTSWQHKADLNITQELLKSGWRFIGLPLGLNLEPKACIPALNPRHRHRATPPSLMPSLRISSKNALRCLPLSRDAWEMLPLQRRSGSMV